MKATILVIILLTLSFGTRGKFLSKPSDNNLPALQTPGSLSFSTHQPEEDITARDTVWKEAIADGSLDYSVFGRYARNKEYYSKLAERFEQADTNLFGSDFFILYYGFAYRDEYDGGRGLKSWEDMAKEERYDEAYEMVCSALNNSPATPNFLANALELAYLLNRPDEEIYNLKWRLYELLSWIYALGDGSESYPWVVTSVSDEYTFMYYFLKVQLVKGQSLLHNAEEDIYYDRIEIEPLDNDFFKGSQIWFDTTYSFMMWDSPGHWAKKLIAEEEE